jgi:hypothetical protein
MANLNNLESPAPLSTTNTQIIGAGYTLPSGFNDLRQPGELSVLYAQNSDAIYNKYKLQTDSTNPLLKFGPKQPFFSFTPNTGTKGLNSLKIYENRAAPVGSGPQDILRITKFTISANGVIFATAQTLLQGFNPFPETKIYNPAMPILAATSIASLGLIERPTRFIEPNGIGALAALGVKGSKTNTIPPKGTVGNSNQAALSKLSLDGGKGFLRAPTAIAGDKSLKTKWVGKQDSSGIAGFFKSSTLFGAFTNQTQPNDPQYRADESTYGVMASSTTVFDQAPGNLKYTFDKTVIQKWYAGTNEGTVRKGDTEQTTGVRGRYLRQADGTYLIIGKIGPWNGNRPGNFPTIFGKEVGLSQVGDINQDLRYSKSVGNNITPDQEFKNSEMLINMAYYADAKQPYSTKFTDKESQSVKDIEDNLKKVLDTIISAGYTYNGLTSTDIINQQFSNESYKGYDFIKQLTKDPYSQQREESPFNYRGGYLAQFGLNKRKQLLDDPKGKGLAGSMASDKINLLTVLNEEDVGLDKKYNGDNDDIIKFYFHDLVNNKYIPFRATITGLNENYNGDWTAIEYIGRADKLQSYKGFSRTIGFKFNVVANTIKELLPMWQRINYLVGLTKPANYTQGGQSNSNVYSRFIIPPLVKFTIGDIYKNQPGVIKSIGLNIPENCVWETVSEETSAKFDWSYLNGRIQWQDSIGKVAQFPRECELNINMDLLEKERPVVGGTNFGDYYVETRMGSSVQMSGMTNQNEILDEKGTVDSFSKNLYMNFPGGITLSTQRDIDKARKDQLRLQEANTEQIARLEEEIALNKTADEIRSAAEQYNYQLKMEQEEQAANRRDQFESSYMNVNNQPTQDRLNEEYEMDRTGL